MKVLVPRTFIPGEALAIAAQFESIAGRLQDIASNLDRVGGSLNGNWEGNAKNSFFDAFKAEPGKLRSTVSLCRQYSRAIRRMTVTDWEEKEVSKP